MARGASIGVLLLVLLLGYALCGEVDEPHVSNADEDARTCAATTSPRREHVVVTVYSYDRPRQLLLLLRDIERESLVSDVSVLVHVVDDNSFDCVYSGDRDNVYDTKESGASDLREVTKEPTDVRSTICPSEPRYRNVLDFVRARRWKFFTAKQRHGKRRYWHLVSQAHQVLKSVDADYFVFLPDDDRLCFDFFRKAIKAWNGIPDPRKVTLMMHIEASREFSAVWTSLKPKKEGDVYRIGWVESGNFLCTRLLLDIFNFSFPWIPTNRWDNRPTLSSGVGSTFSETLHKRRYAMFRTANSLVAHIGNIESKMNPTLRQVEQLLTLHFEDGPSRLKQLMAEPPSVEAALASKWTRLRSLQCAVHSLASQVDCVHVYLNDYEFVPAFLRDLSWVDVVRSQDAMGDIGDSGKFYWAGKLDAQYVFSADDDNIYPPDYVEKMVAFVDTFEPPVVVGLHGIILLEHRMKPQTGQSRGYYASREVFMGVETVSEQKDVNFLGTGLLVYRPEDLPKLTVTDFKEHNMADIWFGLATKDSKVPMVVMPHDADWIVAVKGTFEDSLYTGYTRQRHSDKKLTAVVLAEWPWPIYHPVKRNTTM